MSKMFYNIRQQELNISIPTPVVANSIDYVEVYGSFSSDWKDAVKTVFFNQGDVTYKIIMRGNVIAKDKHLNLGKGSWNTWVMGDIYNSAGTITSRITTHVLNFTVLESGYIDENIIYVEPDVGEQILTIAQAALEAAQEAEKRAQSVVDAAARGDFDGAAGGEGKQGKQGEKGEAGKDGVNAVITGVTASVTQSVGEAKVDVITAGTPSERSFEFYFSGIKGETGAQGEAFRIKGYVASVDDLPANPKNGDVYGVGTEAPYEIYIYDENTGWIDNGQIQGPKGDAAVISSASAEIKNTKVADPELNFVMGGTESDRTFKFTFDGLQGKQGESGVYVGTGTVPDGTKVWVNPDGESVTFVEVVNNAGAHNAIYRGKQLGTSVSDAQYAAIKAGTFEDLYIGDYWVINDVTWRIAAFDYYLTTGDTACNTHHVTIVPNTRLYAHVMNDTNTTEGGYIGSKMYTEGLTQAKTTINNAFGSAHILTHRLFLCNAVTNGAPSGRSWYDSTVELMTEQNVYGCKIYGPMGDGVKDPWSAMNNYEVDKSQYPLFAHDPHTISNRQWYWLRDNITAAAFAYVGDYGHAGCGNASRSAGVRPAFSIIG